VLLVSPGRAAHQGGGAWTPKPSFTSMASLSVRWRT